MNLSIVLPAYEERENLAIFIPQIESEFKDVSFEIIVVDDSSQDGTRELLQELNQKYQNIVFVERPGLFGIGSALRDGYNKSRGEYILSSDADLSFNIKDMRSLYEKIQTGFDLVLGYYTTYQSIEAEKRVGGCVTVTISRISNIVMRVLGGVGNLKNYNTNFRIIRSSAWKSIQTVENQNFFLFETIFRAKQNGARVAEIPVIFSSRKFGESKLNFFQQAPKYFFKLIRFRLFGHSS